MKLIPSAKSERQYESILSMEQCKELLSSFTIVSLLILKPQGRTH